MLHSTPRALHALLDLSSVTSAPEVEPSFDGSAAVQPDELAICNNDGLAKWRLRVGSRFETQTTKFLRREKNAVARDFEFMRPRGPSTPRSQSPVLVLSMRNPSHPRAY
jgi:hypothetical protein